MELKKSNRNQARIRIALQGVSGSGKSYSSLLLAYGICQDWHKIAIIDSENGSANLYSHLGEYNVLNLTAPYSTERYIEAIDVCEKAGMDVIIIDSLSHNWEGNGGILDVHANMAGNSFTNWSKLTPKMNTLVQKILTSSCHIISTIRSKQDYVITENNGKSVPQKTGLKGIVREGTDYDYTIVMELDIYNNASCTKDRTQLFNSRIPFKIDESVGKKIKNWCKDGEGYKDNEIIEMINACKTFDELNELHKNQPYVRKFTTYLNNRAAVIKGEARDYRASLNGQAV
ncbi:MAG: AAA family ATPase [Flavobacterium sp.]